MKKWIGISLGTLLGISHIGMIGMIARKESFPKLNLPIGEYTSYNVIANKEGYTINKVIVIIDINNIKVAFLDKLD